MRRDVPRLARYDLDVELGHRFLFRDLVPATCPELAGGLRGSSGALLTYNVAIRSDPAVGTPYGFVAMAMRLFKEHCNQLLAAYAGFVATGPTPTPAARLIRFAQVLADLLEELFRIHPFANGNGHAGRLVLFTLALRSGFGTYSWHIDPRPAYDAALKQFRAGKRLPLERLLIEALSGGPVPLKRR